MRRARVFVSIVVIGAPIAGAIAIACGGDTSSSTPAPTATTPVTPPGNPPPPPPNNPPPPPPTAPPPAGNPPKTCKEYLAAHPGTATGAYVITPGGVSGNLSVWCDMTFDGGGWTLIQSFTGADSPSDSAAAGAGDGGVLVRQPEPGHLGGLIGAVVQQLANNSTQIHIRLSFQSDAGADGGTWVSTIAPDAGQTTVAMANLRALDLLTKDTDGGYAEWTGPQATAEKLSWEPLYGGGPGTCYTPVQTTKYPGIYWACGNFTSMNILTTQSLCRWTYSPNTGNEPMEVYVR